MSPEFGVFIMMSNYFHDVATALLAASGIALWIVLERFESSKRTDESRKYFLKIYRSIVRFAWFSVSWILMAGLLRIVYFADFEWANAVEKNQETALVAKLVIAFVFVVFGVFIWLALNKKVKRLRIDHRP